MEKNIKIDKNLKFDFADLMINVDLDRKFTLKDVLSVCMKSKIPLPILGAILRCNYIKDYWEEANKKKNDKNYDMDYLEIYWTGSTQTYEGKTSSENMWCFHGVGKEGCVGDDVKEVYKCQKRKIPKNYRENYAVEMTPINNLANYPIKVRSTLFFEYYDDKHYEKIYDFKPSVTLIELLHAILWELSFLGSIDQRDKKLKELGESLKEIKEAKKNGTLNKITMSYEDFKKKYDQKSKGKV
jgi:hypothetical protein